ncbi:type 2 lanthipeptide synthetase LanM family protein [Dictyobacter aurantiacus]|uniref:Type 2 lantibiotic biosynthesis protein n=1 Tax=Dictyobacter aurantiacus TaxID=1936993 RepID=A0A401ZH03_9CHLR|nr:type 2 lanthipeptide synthetase LanM family protein [Dictyobacter aurantiacus]GCE05968.1 type 2 lantibiotic biosynthesis protein [Dictyobacter aurantiacus]
MKKILTTTTHTAPLLWQTPHWYHATTLEERIASLSAANTNFASEQNDKEQAHKKLQRWKEQLPFNNGSSFADRLAMDGITEEDLLVLLGEPIEALYARLAQAPAPDWLTRLADNLETDDSLATIARLFKEAEDTPGAYALLQPFYPLMQKGVDQLQAQIAVLSERYDRLPFRPDTILALLLPNLARQIMPKISRTFVLELNIARLRGQLQGDTPRERFRCYLQQLGQHENLRAFLEEYCILARQLMVTIDAWVDCSLEFLRHLCKDWEEILAVFSPEQAPGILIKVAGGAGDTHRNGHSVMILKFQSGWQLVYKPRSLGIDAHFQELLTWLNTRGNHPAFRTLKVVNKVSYGWMEYVPDTECTSEDEIRRFYERQGGYLALLYALDAIDFHAENVIAAGEHPLLIDLEALFHPRIKIEGAYDIERPAANALAHSVTRIALLPQRIWSNDEAEGIDMSGLGRTEGQLTPHPIAQWEDVGTDEMKLIRERVKMSGNKNCPKFHGQNVLALDFIDSLITGFTSMYQLLMKHRDAFIADVLPRFAHDEVRFIARATRTYALLLTESSHPNVLRDALKQERFFDRLWIAAEDQPHLQRLIPAERADMQRGDVPIFTTHPDSRDLFTSQGKRIPGFFAATSMESVKQHIQQLNEKDLYRQVWMIRAAFTSIPESEQYADRWRDAVYTSQVNCLATCHERLLAAACAIGNRLDRSALRTGQLVDWYGVTHVKEHAWSIAPAGMDLYSGLPGIILFLSYLSTTTGDAHYRDVARQALKTLRLQVAQVQKRPALASIGAFTGIGSCIYLFSHLARLWREPVLLQEAEALVQLFPSKIEQDTQFNIVDGAAGCLANLLVLNAVAPSPATLATAIKCGDHLLAHAYPISEGLTWKTSKQEPLTGFSHGTIGIAWSLFKLAAASGEERFRQAASLALAYERSLFSSARQSRQLRNSSGALQQDHNMKNEEELQQAYGMAWSRGMPGIALGLLDCLQYVDDASMHCEVEMALNTIIAYGAGYHHKPIGPNHSLYHGDAGNLEALLVASQTLAHLEYHQHVEHIASRFLEHIERSGGIMGVPLNVETPGLMLGLSGIGYELLRLARPDAVPSILLLVPPINFDEMQMSKQ